MQNAEKILFKNKLKEVCQLHIQHRMDAAKLAIQHAQESANSEEKSSAGDKYETSRAMSHLEKDMHSRQLAEIIQELATLHAINVAKLYTVGEPGAFIECSGVCFFVGAGLGKQVVDTKEIYFLSPKAPLARLLQNKKPGDIFVFDRVETRIIDIY